MNFLSNRLGRRIVALMVLASAALSVLAAIAQLYFSYRYDLDRVMGEFETVETSFISGLENALWEFNFAQTQVLLDGVYAQEAVTAVDLKTTTGQHFVRGEAGGQHTVQREFSLQHTRPSGQENSVGVLVVTLSLDEIRSRLFGQFLTLAGANFLKTIAASLIMLLIFERMVSRHLRQITSYVSQVDWNTQTDDLVLPEDTDREPDDFRNIVAALNSSRARLQNSRKQTDSLNLRMEAVLKAATSGIIGFDTTGMVSTINPQAQHILGILEQELPCRWPSKIEFLNLENMSRLDASESPIERALAGQVLKNETAIMSRASPQRDPRYVRISSAALPVEDTSSIKTVIVIDDVSEQERNRQQVERASRLDALGQLTGGVAHDFNNLLSTIAYNLELALIGSQREKREEQIKAAMASVKRGASLTKRLLAFAKRQPGIAKSWPVSKVLSDFESLVRPTIEEVIGLAVEYPSEELNVYCDTVQLENALLNLVINARDAIVRAGKGSKITIMAREVTGVGNDATLKREDGQTHVANELSSVATRFVEFSVSDDGPGMSEEVRRRALDPFFTTKETNSGTGLGLSMVYGFIQQSDGQIRVYSEDGHGTTIRLLIPSGREDGTHEDPVETDVQLGSGQTVLLVEDEPELSAAMGELIEHLGYQVVKARQAADAIKILQSEQLIDCMLTDIVMPGALGGFDLAKKARELRPELSIIYMSGYSGFSQEQMGSVVAPLLVKPATPYEVSAALHAALSPGQMSD